MGILVSRSYPQVSVSTPLSVNVSFNQGRATGLKALCVKKLVRNQPSLAGVRGQGAESEILGRKCCVLETLHSGFVLE